jgi:glucoamylase
LKVIDATLKVETPRGTSWHRYNGDQYGEAEDGSPFNFDTKGIGRAWPLLTGERATYELMAGRRSEAVRLLGSMAAFACEGGMIPEQVWDVDDIPERRLFKGRPSGSAMPLVWAHAEYVKLRRSLQDGRVFDLPAQTVRRYLEEGSQSNLVIWRFDHQRSVISPGEVLRVEVLAPAVVRWSTDGGRTPRETPTRDTGLGVHVADLDPRPLRVHDEIQLTFRWPEAGDRWEGKDFTVAVVDAS